MAVCQNLVPLVNIKIAGKWMFIPLELIIIGFDPPPYNNLTFLKSTHSTSTHSNSLSEGGGSKPGAAASKLPSSETFTSARHSKVMDHCESCWSLSGNNIHMIAIENVHL
jgi:hypothetical protein